MVVVLPWVEGTIVELVRLEVPLESWVICRCYFVILIRHWKIVASFSYQLVTLSSLHSVWSGAQLITGELADVYPVPFRAHYEVPTPGAKRNLLLSEYKYTMSPVSMCWGMGTDLRPRGDFAS